MGNHFLTIIILVIELLLGTFIATRAIKMKLTDKKMGKAKRAFYPEVSFDNMMDTSCMVRCSDRMPVYFSDNFGKVLKTSEESLKNDIEKLDDIADNKELFQIYSKWDGTEPLVCAFKIANDERWMQMSVARDESGQYDLFVFGDITECKKECFELEDKIRKAEEESMTKSQFLSRMSHEIRTPMNGIIGMFSLAQKQCKEDELVVEYLGKAENLSHYLLSVINDILDLSRIEAGKLELEEKPMDLREIAEKLRNMFKETIEAKNVKFDVSLQHFDTYYLIGDETRLCQVLINFLSHASKFTSEGEITVTFRQMFKENNKVDFMIKVHDTGIGIEPEFLDKIFRPFEQESTNIAHKYGGGNNA